MHKINSSLSAIAGVALSGFLSWAVSPAWADIPNSWTATGSMTTSRRHAAVTSLPDGKILVVGGVDTTGTDFSGSTFYDTAEIYNPVTGTWSNTGSLQTGGRALHTATLLRNGNVLITGGWNGTASLNTAELYDPVSGTFTQTTNTSSVITTLTVGRSQHTATLLDNGKVLIAGGYGTGPLASAELFDPNAGTFASTTGSMSEARNTHTATLLPNGKVLVAGGYGLAGELASAELYDPTSGANGSFNDTSNDLLQGRGSHRATTLPNGTVLITGGNGGGAALSSAEVYDVNVGIGGTFRAVAPLNNARQWHSAVLMANGKVLISHGNNNASGHWDIQTNFLSSAEIYDPVGEDFQVTNSAGIPRSAANRIVLWTGRVLVVGGGSNTAELFCPEIAGIEGTWTPTANNLTTARSNFQTTLLDNGDLLNTGGLNQAGNPLASAELYDYITNTFSPTGSMTIARYQQRDILLSNGKVLVTGGRSAAAANTLNTAELYDPVTGTFSLTPTNMGTFRRVHRLTRLADNRILISGGRGGTLTTSNGILASAQIYDPVTGLFSATGNMQVARTNHRTTRLPDGRVLITGGTGTAGVLASAEIFDPNGNSGVGTFTLLAASMSVPRDGHTSTLLPIGKVLIIGGNDDDLNPLASAELFDPATLTFSPAGSMNVNRDFQRTTILDNGKVLISGGRTSNTQSSVTASSELYDFTTGISKLTGNLNVPRELHSGLGLPNGLTIMIGGIDPSGTVLASAELYSTPICNTPPVCNNDAYPAIENVALVVGGPGVLGNDSDFDGNPLNAVLVSAPNPAHGSVTLNPNGGFTFTPAPDFVGTTSFTYMANDGQADSNVGTVIINVFGVPTTTTPSATAGVAYNQTLTVIGGTAPFTWSLVAGALPPGLTLSAAGVISGTPNTTGTFNFTVRVTDASGAFDEEALTIVVGSSDGDEVVIPTINTVVDNLNFPFGVAVDNGNVYIADRNNHVVKKLSGGVLTVVAGCSIVSLGNCAPTLLGTGEDGYNGDGIAATAAQLNSPLGVAVANGNLFIADSGNHIVRKVVLSTGIITTVAGIPQKNGLAVNGGPATLAELFGPRGVAVDGAGNIYIADTMNQQIRKVDGGTGIITAVAGVAGETGSNDGPVAEARLNSPYGVAVDISGSLIYIADQGNDLIRTVDEGVVAIVEAGVLDSPAGVALDLNGNLYIADTDNHWIRRVSPEGVVTTVAGTGVATTGLPGGLLGDGGAATTATLNTPVAVAVDSTGRFLYIADLNNQRIRKVDFTPDVIP